LFWGLTTEAQRTLRTEKLLICREIPANQKLSPLRARLTVKLLIRQTASHSPERLVFSIPVSPGIEKEKSILCALCASVVNYTGMNHK
jgi:hypothetical protein